jgi:hypothetical protein
MAFNSFDKLCKAQRDYPKPKFAYAVVEKALKKQPQNAYILVQHRSLYGYIFALKNMTDMESGSHATIGPP